MQSGGSTAAEASIVTFAQDGRVPDGQGFTLDGGILINLGAILSAASGAAARLNPEGTRVGTGSVRVEIGIDVGQTTADTIAITGNGTIDGHAGSGIRAASASESIVLGTTQAALGAVSGVDTAIRASTGGAGSVGIVTGGDVTSTNTDAISARTDGSGSIGIALGAGTTVTGASAGGVHHGAGVRAVATGSGDVSLTAGDGVSVIGDQPGSLATAAGGNVIQDFGANATVGGTSGLVNDQTGAGGGSSTINLGASGIITASGVDATDPYQGQGLFNGNQGLGATRITTGTGTGVTSSGSGVVLVQTNSANAEAVSVATGGDVTGQGDIARLPTAYSDQLATSLGSASPTGYGVLAVNAGTGTLTVDTRGGTILAAQDGSAIAARNGGGLLNVTNADTLRHDDGVTGGSGISAVNTSNGAVRVTNTGTIASATGSTQPPNSAFENGITANAQTGAIAIDNQAGGTIGADNNALAGTGIVANGGGSITITNAANIDATGNGIAGLATGSGTLAINQTAGTIEATFGIATLTTGDSNVAITTNGAITATATAIGVNSAHVGNTVALGQNADVRGEIGLQVSGITTRLTNAGALASTDPMGNAVQVESGRLVIGAGAGTFTGGFQVTSTDSVLAFDRADALSLANTIRGDGSLVQQGTGRLTLSGANTYEGGTAIRAGGSLALAAAGAAGTGAISLGGTSGTATASLVLETNAQVVGGTFRNTLDRFDAQTDTLDLRGFAFSGTGSVTYTAVNGQLTVRGGAGGTETQRFALTNSSSSFLARDDGNGGTSITVLCFCAGTRILTMRGEIPVEDLTLGDLVVTASGAHRPIRWIGHRAIAGNGELVRPDQQPIRIRAGAFGPGRPVRDLRLSPGHPVLVGQDDDNAGGYLVPAMCLINGTTIAREAAVSVTYWHIELDAHDILLAEGLPAESYLDGGDRPFFTKSSDHALHNPDFIAPDLHGRCRPVAVDGPIVETERARLSLVFATELAGHCAWDEVYGLDAMYA